MRTTNVAAVIQCCVPVIMVWDRDMQTAGGRCTGCGSTFTQEVGTVQDSGDEDRCYGCHLPTQECTLEPHHSGKGLF
jgi:hypothetical protein